jgi:hypothetical protein
VVLDDPAARFGNRVQHPRIQFHQRPFFPQGSGRVDPVSDFFCPERRKG